MKSIKRFLKELKRARWPSIKETNHSFYKSLIFIIISSLFLLSISLLFTLIWKIIGVGV